MSLVRPAGLVRFGRSVSGPLLLAVVAGVPGLAASSALVAQESGTSTSSVPVVPRVTALVRAGLAAPGDSTVWVEMASLLPELARSGEAGVLETFEAARVADSLSTAPFDPVVVALESGRTTAAASRRALGLEVESTAPAAAATPGESLPNEAPLSSGTAPLLRAAANIAPWTLPWLLVATLLVATQLLKRRASVEAKRVASPVRSGRRPGNDRLWAVTTLARSGLPPSEIARQTGMAQDVVRVLMEMGSVPRTAGSSRATGRPAGMAATGMAPTSTGAGARPRTPEEQAAGITAERTALSRQARTLRDGRITYAPRVTR